MDRIAKHFAFIIVFLGGWNFALPVAQGEVALPFWSQPIQVMHGVFLTEVLLMLYLLIFAATGAAGRIRVGLGEGRFVLLILGLGCLGILSAAVNLTDLLDLGQAARFFYYAAFLLIVIRWAERLGPARILRFLLMGIAGAGMLNLYYAFKIQWATMGDLPFLMGQNGPGGILGLAVGLGAWLMLIRKTRLDAVVAVIVSLVGIFGASISYSKTAMLLAAVGVAAWVAVILAAMTGRQTRRLGAGLLALVLIIAVGISSTTAGRSYAETFKEFIRYKFYSLDYRENTSVESRGLYFFSVAEIVAQHPLTGVGYSGFYEAVTQTVTYRSGGAVEETASRTANPHNAFLYYASANGLPGLVVVVVLFLLFVDVLRRSLLPYYGNAGRVVWVCLSVAYFIHGNTLPTLYNTEVMYLPAAVAFSQLVLRSQLRNANDVGALRSKKCGRGSAPLIGMKALSSARQVH